MTSVFLQRHPDMPAAESLRLQVDAVRPAEGGLSLRYLVTGAAVRLTPPERPERADELWRTTCFEAFIRRSDGGYYELNFAPSRRWAAYSFDGYRSGMALAPMLPPRIEVRRTSEAIEIAVSVDTSGLPELAAPWRLGLSAVLEESTGSISYWALAHTPGKPDFHHPDSFVLELPPSDRS